MKPTTHMRQGQTIIDLETGEVTDHKSINKAKKASLKIQKDQDKLLGRGSVQRRALTTKYQPIPLEKTIVSRKRQGG